MIQTYVWNSYNLKHRSKSTCDIWPLKLCALTKAWLWCDAIYEHIDCFCHSASTCYPEWMFIISRWKQLLQHNITERLNFYNQWAGHPVSLFAAVLLIIGHLPAFIGSGWTWINQWDGCVSLVSVNNVNFRIPNTVIQRLHTYYSCYIVLSCCLYCDVFEIRWGRNIRRHHMTSRWCWRASYERSNLSIRLSEWDRHQRVIQRCLCWRAQAWHSMAARWTRFPVNDKRDDDGNHDANSDNSI